MKPPHINTYSDGKYQLDYTLCAFSNGIPDDILICDRIDSWFSEVLFALLERSQYDYIRLFNDRKYTLQAKVDKYNRLYNIKKLLE